MRDVEVRAAVPPGEKTIAFNDCCFFCDNQFLQAVTPTLNGPVKHQPGDPLRHKFCGTITNYGVNDERNDPHDIIINLRPAAVPPYPNFVAGLVKTVESPPFGSPNCGQQNCAAAASDLQKPPRFGDKVIHAEVTPDEHFFGADGRFLPIEGNFPRCAVFAGQQSNKKCTDCIHGDNCLSELEPRDGHPGAEACVYGVYAYDHGTHHPDSHTQLCCTKDSAHDHPEIHPFDAIWWRHPERNGWIFGVFQDDSNRYSFEHCGDDNNGNDWSQAPRDLTFSFPFRFPLESRMQRACLRHVRTRRLRDDEPNIVRPLNITTGVFADPAPEVTRLVIAGRRLLEVRKELKSEKETHVAVFGSIIGGDVVGQIVLRVSVGCDERTGKQCDTRFDKLKGSNPLVNYDKGDPGAGYYYSELTFQCACP